MELPAPELRGGRRESDLFGGAAGRRPSRLRGSTPAGPSGLRSAGSLFWSTDATRRSHVLSPSTRDLPAPRGPLRVPAILSFQSLGERIQSMVAQGGILVVPTYQL